MQKSVRKDKFPEVTQDRQDNEAKIGLALQQALDAMNDIYVVYDAEWRFVYQNRAQREAMVLLGIDPDAAMGRNLWEVMPFLAGTKGEAGTRRAMEERVITEWEETYPHLRLHGRAFPTPDGGVAVVARDVTNQWKAENQHREAEERTAALQATTAALASAMTLDKVAAVIVSRGLETVGAYAGSVALVENDELHIIAASGYDPEFITQYERFKIADDLPLSIAVRTGEPVILRSSEERDTRFPHLMEARRRVGSGAAAAIPLIIDGRVLGGLGMNFRDGEKIEPEDAEFMTTLAQQCAQGIERARLYEAEKAARSFAEEANKAKTDFLTTMSHELRTPLNAIGGYADLLLAGIRGNLTEEQTTDLERIKRSQRHLLSLINDVLNFAKLQAGIVQIAQKEVDIDEIASGIEVLVTPQLLKKNISYRFVSAVERCAVMGDSEKIEQILLNLLSNAIKYTESGGSVTVALSCDANTVSINVADTGSGISPDKLQAVFEPFVQLNRTRTTSNEGAGLGLAISRDLARAMHGDLTVTSELGSGSTFTLTLPRAL